MPASPVPPPRRRRAFALGAAAAVLLTTAGCGGGGGNTSSQPPPPPSAAPVSSEQLFADLRAAAATGPVTAATLSAGLATSGKLEGEAGSAAAELRAALAAGLVEHVALTGLAALSEYRFGASSAQATAAVSALQANGASVADAIGRAASSEEREQFAAAWGERVSAILAYASAADDGDAGESARQAASASLAANARKLGTVLADATDDVLSTAAVQRQFVTAATRVTAVLDALGSGNVEAAKRLRAADEQAGDLAASLAAGLDRSAELAGDPSRPAAELRADLAGLFTEGAYLTGWAGFLTFSSPQGVTAPMAVAARDASDANAQALATAVGGGIGRDKQAGFISLWRDAVDNLNNYATIDESSRAAAGARLAAFPANAASFLADASGGALAAPDVTAALTSAVQALIKSVDGLRSLKDVPAAVPTQPVTEPTSTPEPTVSGSPDPSVSATATATP